MSLMWNLYLGSLFTPLTVIVLESTQPLSPVPLSICHVCKQHHIHPKLPHPWFHSLFSCAFRNKKGPPGVEDAEDKCENIITIENGIPCDPLDMKRGHINDGFLTEDERLTPLWELQSCKKISRCLNVIDNNRPLKS